MSVLLSTVAPVFGLMAFGFVAARLRWLDDATATGLVRFVFDFAIPILVFGSVAGLEVPPDISWGFLGAFYAGSGTAWALSLASARWLFGRDLAAQAIFGMCGAFANLVLLGIPVVTTALGEEAAVPMFLIIGIDATIVMPLTVALIHAGRRGPRRAPGTGTGTETDAPARRAEDGHLVLALLRNPIILGLFAGLLWNALGVPMPSGLDRMVGMMGDAAVPTALFAMGASLSGYPWRGDLLAATLLTTLKLVVHPLVAWVVAVPVLGLEGVWASVPVVLAAMPTAVNAYLFGARYDAAPGVAARTVILSSALALLTLSTLLVLLA